MLILTSLSFQFVRSNDSLGGWGWKGGCGYRSRGEEGEEPAGIGAGVVGRVGAGIGAGGWKGGWRKGAEGGRLEV